MERTIYKNLLNWKDASDRKPLILLGARQVGKTYILKEFGLHEFDNLVYVNCHNNPFTQVLFNDFSVSRIVHSIEVFYEVKVEIGKTLLFFDEIQKCDLQRLRPGVYGRRRRGGVPGLRHAPPQGLLDGPGTLRKRGVTRTGL